MGGKDVYWYGKYVRFLLWLLTAEKFNGRKETPGKNKLNRLKITNSLAPNNEK